MKSQNYFISVLVIILLHCATINSQPDLTSFSSKVAEIYKGNIEDAADYIAEFPTNAEADETLGELNSVSEEIRAMLYGEIQANPARINEINSYLLEVYRTTEILQWNLLHIYEHQSINLLPGEGIKLTLKSYCLNHEAASPAPDEFYYVDEIPSDKTEWLTPLLNYINERPENDYPVQGLIWNMNKGVAFNDLPSDQKQLLSSAIPDAEDKYGKDIIDKGVEEVIDLFGKKVKKEVEPVSDAIEVIDDISKIESDLENRISKLKLILPQHDTYQLKNGLLVRAQSTGSYKSIILTIVNPRINDVGFNSSLQRKFNFASIDKYEKTFDLKEFFQLSVPAYKPGKWGDRLKKAKGFSEKCLDAKEKLQNLEDFVDDPDGYVKGRGFDEGLDFFKSFTKGNKQAQDAFESFRQFNKDQLEARKNKSNREQKSGDKSMKPSDFTFKPGRNDVQPLEPVFGCG